MDFFPESKSANQNKIPDQKHSNLSLIPAAPDLRSDSESDYSASNSDEDMDDGSATAKTPSKVLQIPSEASQTPGKTPSKRGKKKVRAFFLLDLTRKSPLNVFSESLFCGFHIFEC